MYEPEYSQEEFTQIEGEAAAAAAEQALPLAEDEEPERTGLLCSPIDTNGVFLNPRMPAFRVACLTSLPVSEHS